MYAAQNALRSAYSDAAPPAPRESKRRPRERARKHCPAAAKTSSSKTLPPTCASLLSFDALQLQRLRLLVFEAARLERRHRWRTIAGLPTNNVESGESGNTDPLLEILRIRARCVSLEALLRAGRNEREPSSVTVTMRAELARTYALGGMHAQALDHSTAAISEHDAITHGRFGGEEDAASFLTELPRTAEQSETTRAALRALSQLRCAFLNASREHGVIEDDEAEAGDVLVPGMIMYAELHAIVSAFNHGDASNTELAAMLRPSFAAVEMLRVPTASLAWSALVAHVRKWVPPFRELGQTLEDALSLHRASALLCVFEESKRSTVESATMSCYGAGIHALREAVRGDSELSTFLRKRVGSAVPAGGDDFANNLGASLLDADVGRLAWEDVLEWALNCVVCDPLVAVRAQLLLTAADSRIGLANAAAAASAVVKHKKERSRSRSPGRSKGKIKSKSKQQAGKSRSKSPGRTTSKQASKKKVKAHAATSRSTSEKAASKTTRAARASSSRATRDAQLGEARLLLRDVKSALKEMVVDDGGDADADTAGGVHLSMCALWASLGREALASRKTEMAIEWQQRICDAKRKVLGTMHIETACAQNALGELFSLVGDSTSALEEFTAALDVRRAASAPPPIALALRVFRMEVAACLKSVDDGNTSCSLPPPSTVALREGASSLWQGGDEEEARKVLWEAATALQELDVAGSDDEAAAVLVQLVEYVRSSDEPLQLGSALEWLGSALITSAAQRGGDFSKRGWSHLAKAKEIFTKELGPTHANVRALERRLATFQ